MHDGGAELPRIELADAWAFVYRTRAQTTSCPFSTETRKLRSPHAVRLVASPRRPGHVRRDALERASVEHRGLDAIYLDDHISRQAGAPGGGEDGIR